MKTYNCPECGANVPLADMNVAADVALCRACGTRSRIAELRESGDDATDYKALSGPTPKHVKVVRDLNDPSGKVELRYWKFSPVVLFLIPFTCVWSGMSIGVIYGSQIAKHALDWKLSLFGIPFLVGTVVLVGVILNMLFARRRLVLERGHGAYSAKVFGIGRARHFDLNRETKLSVEQAAMQPKDGACNFMVRVKNGNLSEKVCAYWDKDALDYALAMMKRYRA